ncbi:hypothetical protein B0O80DRAFT_70094 [Mortierella sp. GBAus27b]|nr:hypothetical protein B0O80DRAFT_70094 [Mortierella sp. GBAus27b]
MAQLWRARTNVGVDETSGLQAMPRDGRDAGDAKGCGEVMRWMEWNGMEWNEWARRRGASRAASSSNSNSSRQQRREEERETKEWRGEQSWRTKGDCSNNCSPTIRPWTASALPCAQLHTSHSPWRWPYSPLCSCTTLSSSRSPSFLVICILSMSISMSDHPSAFFLSLHYMPSTLHATPLQIYLSLSLAHSFSALLPRRHTPQGVGGEQRPGQGKNNVDI